MAQSAANLVDHVLPIVPLRQFVITFPFELRARLAYDGKQLAAATRLAIDSVLGFYKRRIRDVDGVVGQSGAVSVVQRVSSDLRLNPHLRAIFLDGGFATDSGSPVFHPLLHLGDSDLTDLLQVIRVRVLNVLEPYSAETHIARNYWQFHTVLDLVRDSVLAPFVRLVTARPVNRGLRGWGGIGMMLLCILSSIRVKVGSIAAARNPCRFAGVAALAIGPTCLDSKFTICIID
jgi:hypothetical protein